MFPWLNDIAQFLVDWIPKPIIVRPDEELLEFLFGKYPRVYKAGWYIEWRVFASYEVVSIQRQTTEVEQEIIIPGGQALGIVTTIVYRVHDSLTLATSTYDYEQTIIDIAKLSVKERVHDLNPIAIMSDRPLDEALFEDLDAKLHEYGVSLVDCGITHVAPILMHTIRGVK